MNHLSRALPQREINSQSIKLGRDFHRDISIEPDVITRATRQYPTRRVPSLIKKEYKIILKHDLRDGSRARNLRMRLMRCVNVIFHA